MQPTPKAELPLDARTLPARYYVDADHFLVERERFFGQKWVYAGRAEDTPSPGDAVLREVAGESVIVVRGEDGVLRAFFNVCRHRGTRLLEQAACVGKRIQCPYHAWTFDLAGRLVAAPHMEEGPRFQKADYPLKPVALDVWDGHVFLNLSEHPEPLASQLGDLPGKFAAWGMASLRRAERLTYSVAANWKLIIQNYSECLHCPIIHPALQQLSHYLSGENEPANPSYLGGRMELRDGIRTMAMNGDGAGRKPLPGLDAAELRRVYFYAILPNLLLSPHPDFVMTHELRPLAHDRTEIVCDFLVPPEEQARRGFTLADAVAFWDLTNRQDWHVSELTQLGMTSRAYSPGPYSNREDLLYDFDRIVADRG
jgi:Rieske 2Fe-2S family protein